MKSAPALSRFAWTGAFACIVGALACQPSRAMELLPRPGEGAVTEGAYTNKYFNLVYPLPSGWTEGLAGPEPSQHGYYVLTTLIPAAEFTGMVMIAAQDQFFAPKPASDAMAVADELGWETMKLEGMKIDRPSLESSVGARSFSRIDTSGFGLFNSTWVTQSRCHLVSFNIMTKTPQLRDELAHSLEKLTSARERGDENPDPVCLKNQAETKNLVTRVDPPAIAPFMPIPVRLVIRRDGGVKHVNVVRGSAGQRQGIETALQQWKFKPPAIDGRPAEIETGLVIQFTPEGQVRYSGGERLRQF